MDISNKVKGFFCGIYPYVLALFGALSYFQGMIYLNVVRIAQLRKRKNIFTQGKLAQIAGWDRAYLSSVLAQSIRQEPVSVSTDSLDRLCAALGCKIRTILIHK
jgi:DNA-binding Xre family transcriptional regulator